MCGIPSFPIYRHSALCVVMVEISSFVNQMAVTSKCFNDIHNHWSFHELMTFKEPSQP